MARVYSLISGKGGTGKTTTAINIAAALNHLGKNSIIVDANLSTPNVGLHLGAPIVPVTLNHVLNEKAEAIDAIYEHQSGIKIVPASLSSEEVEKIKFERLIEVIDSLRELSDFVIIDSSAGIGIETKASIAVADEVILVTQAEMPSVTDALKAAKLAEKLHKRIKGFVVTRYTGGKTEMSMESIRELLDHPLLGIIAEDKNVQRSLILKNPLFYSYPRSKASRNYLSLAHRLLGVPERRGFFSRIFG